MSHLNICYSHRKERRIANTFGERLRSLGYKAPDITQPASGKNVSEVIKTLTCAWERREEGFISQLNWFFGCQFSIQGWNAYLSRFPIFPYGTAQRWFAVPLASPVEKQLKTIGHELFHQPFHLFWEERCKSLLEKQAKVPPDKVAPLVRSLKEALPELLNTEEFRISPTRDMGHDDTGEQLFRYLLRKHYQKNGAFKFSNFLTSTFTQPGETRL